MNGPKSRRLRPILITGCALIIFFLTVASGLALASAGEGGGAHISGAQVKDLLTRILNFVLLVIILVVVMKKANVKDFFTNRKKEIRKKLDDLKKSKDEAESRCQELEKRLNEFDLQKEEIIAQFKADGATERDKIVADANERAKQLLAQADLAIEREIHSARERLKQEVIDIAANRAQEIIAKEIKDDDQERLVNEFTNRVEKLH